MNVVSGNLFPQNALSIWQEILSRTFLLIFASQNLSFSSRLFGFWPIIAKIRYLLDQNPKFKILGIVAPVNRDKELKSLVLGPLQQLYLFADSYCDVSSACYQSFFGSVVFRTFAKIFHCLCQFVTTHEKTKFCTRIMILKTISCL